MARQHPTPHAQPHSGPMLQIANVDFSYKDRAVLHNVSLTIYPGEILVLLGPNGAGKSTLVKTIAGQVKPAGGHVLVDGKDPYTDAEARRATGLVPQSIAIFDKLSVRENLCAFGEVMGTPNKTVGRVATRVLRMIGLVHRQSDRVTVLSGGMRRLVNIGAAMMHGPKLMILDEPTVGVDNKTRDHLRGVMRSLRDSGLAILLTTHDMEEAEALADRITIIVGGEIMADGPPGEIVEAAFGAAQEVRVALDPDVLDDRDFQSFCSRLEKLGLEPSQDFTVWEGLVDDERGALSTLRSFVMPGKPGVLEVRVRQPGLRTLLDWYNR